METSRDDFVIAIRSAFLKKDNQQRFSLIGLIIFSILILLLARINFIAIDYVRIALKELVYRSSFIVSVPENFTKKTYNQIQDHFNFYDDYKKIDDELTKLKSQIQIDNFISSENKRLKKILEDYMDENIEQKTARVIIDNKSPFLKSIVLNKGSKDKIKLGMAILDGSYLVGKIFEVNFSTSRALLLSDLNSKIPVIIEPSGLQAIISGTGQENGIIQYLKSEERVKDSSIVYTSGSGGLFKSA